MNPHQATQRLVASIVAVKFDLARIYTDWSVRGPKLEASTAVTAMAQEEAFHEAFFRGWSEVLRAESGPVERTFKESWARSGAEVRAWLLAIDELAAAGGLAESGQVVRECNPAAFLEPVS